MPIDVSLRNTDLDIAGSLLVTPQTCELLKVIAADNISSEIPRKKVRSGELLVSGLQLL